MSESPLSDTNWEEAQIFEEHVKLVATGPIDVIKNLPEGSLNKELYFGVKARNHKGEWSTISNVVKYVDSGFRSNIDGYQFSNGTQDWGVYPEVEITRNDFTDADFYRMFKEKMGVKEICQENTDSGRNCVLKKKYSLWVEDKKQRTNIGRCLGMVVTSLILFDNPSSLSAFSQTLTVYSDEVNLKDQKVRSFITYYHVEQYAHLLNLQSC